MKKGLTLALSAALVVYSLLILSGYSAGYPEIASLPRFAFFVLYTIGAKLLFILVLALSAYGYGGLLFRRWLPRFGSLLEEGLFKASLGLIIVSYALFFLGLAGLLYPLMGYAVLAAGIGIGAREIAGYIGRASALPRGIKLTFPIVVLISVSAYFLIRGAYEAFKPPTGFDVLMYHLGVPRMYLDLHRIFPTPDIPGSSYPYGIEMLYMLGMMVDGVISANMVNYFFAIAGGLAAAAFARRFFKSPSGLAAFAVYVSVPLIFWLMPQAYIDLAQAAYTMLALHAAAAAFDEGDRRWLVLAALMAGFTLAIKYTGVLLVGVILVVAVFDYLVTRKVGAKDTLAAAGLFLALCAAVSLPWYARNIFYYKNPVYPFLQNVFGGGVSTTAQFTENLTSGGPGGTLVKFISGFWKSTFDARSFQVNWNNGLGPTLLMFIPGVFLFGKMEKGLKYLLVFCLMLFSAFVLTGNVRYFTPVLPALAVAASYPIGRLVNETGRIARVFAAALVVIFAFGALLAVNSRDAVEGFPSASPQAADAYYSQGPWSGYLASYDVWMWINTNLPADAVVYQLWDDASVYFRGRTTYGVSLPWGEHGRQQVHHIVGGNGFGGYLPGEDIINNLKNMGAGYLLINANREGHALPEDPYFQSHSRLLVEHKGVFLYQIVP